MISEKFISPTKGPLSFQEIGLEISNFIKESPENNYRIIIGTDSSGSNGTVDFVTAIVVLRCGQGGRYFWQKNQNKNIKTLRQKVYQETLLSIEIAQKLLEVLKEINLMPSFLKTNIEIHIDIGEKGPTREMIKEIAGMVKGFGLEPKIKPASFAASSVADRYV